MNLVLSIWLSSKQSLDLLPGFRLFIKGYRVFAPFSLAIACGGPPQVCVHFDELRTFDIVCSDQVSAWTTLKKKHIFPNYKSNICPQLKYSNIVNTNKLEKTWHFPEITTVCYIYFRVF